MARGRGYNGMSFCIRGQASRDISGGDKVAIADDRDPEVAGGVGERDPAADGQKLRSGDITGTLH